MMPLVAPELLTVQRPLLRLARHPCLLVGCLVEHRWARGLVLAGLFTQRDQINLSQKMFHSYLMMRIVASCLSATKTKRNMFLVALRLKWSTILRMARTHSLLHSMPLKKMLVTPSTQMVRRWVQCPTLFSCSIATRTDSS